MRPLPVIVAPSTSWIYGLALHPEQRLQRQPAGGADDERFGGQADFAAQGRSVGLLPHEPRRRGAQDPPPRRAASGATAGPSLLKSVASLKPAAPL